MADTTFDDINNLGDISFIAGSYMELIFYVQDELGAAVSLAGTTCSCSFSLYGQTEQVELVKSGTITNSDGGIFKIILDPSDTETWWGKYAGQPKIALISGKEYLPGQLILTIIKKIG